MALAMAFFVRAEEELEVINVLRAFILIHSAAEDELPHLPQVERGESMSP